MCVPKGEFQYVNQATQLALFSECIDNCLSVSNIRWSIYQGSMNTSLNIIEWTPFNQMDFYENIWFFGKYTYKLIIEYLSHCYRYKYN